MVRSIYENSRIKPGSISNTLYKRFAIRIDTGRFPVKRGALRQAQGPGKARQRGLCEPPRLRASTVSLKKIMARVFKVLLFKIIRNLKKTYICIRGC